MKGDVGMAQVFAVLSRYAHSQAKKQIDHALRNGVLSEVYHTSRRSARVYYGSSTKVLLVTSHATTESIYVKIMVSTTTFVRYISS